MATRKAIADLGKSSYIAVSTGFWYEWILAVPAGSGIDFAKRTVTFFDEGETKISTSTLPQVNKRLQMFIKTTFSGTKRTEHFCQVGRAVAALLSLPIKPEGGSNKEASYLSNLQNKVVYVKSFTKEPAAERYASGIQEMQQGKRIGFAKVMFTRVFYPDGCGDFERNKGTLNGLLGLPEEDMDEAAEAAIERSKKSDWVG